MYLSIVATEKGFSVLDGHPCRQPLDFLCPSFGPGSAHSMNQRAMAMRAIGRTKRGEAVDLYAQLFSMNIMMLIVQGSSVMKSKLGSQQQ